MRSKVSERCALAALIALVVYCLACMYPVAWSPDSKKLVFPVFGEDGIAALVMTDLSGKAIRDVARIPAGAKDVTLSPAAWSPDGKWIAYLKFTNKRQNDVDTISAELMLQAADSGKERFLLGVSYPEGKDGPLGSVFSGPGWLGDSKTLAIQSASAGKPVVVLVGLDGKIQREIPLPEDALAGLTVAVAPDGKRLAYFELAEKKTATLVVRDIASGKANKLASTQVKEDWFVRPEWSADSTSVYVFVGDRPNRGRVSKIDVRTGKEKVLWQPKDGGMLYGISVSAATDWIAIACMMNPDKEEMSVTNVINAITGEVRPVSCNSGEMIFSMSISPDGKWVAFCPGTVKGKDMPPTFGVIVSSDGAQMNFFLPDPKAKEQIPKFMSDRLETAFTVSGALEQLKKDGVEAKDVRTPEEAAAVGAALDKFAAGQTSPLFRQASAYGKVQAYLGMMRNQPAADRAKYAGEARKIIDAFLKDHPGAEPVREELKAQLDEILTGRKREPKDDE